MKTTLFGFVALSVLSSTVAHSAPMSSQAALKLLTTVGAKPDYYNGDYEPAPHMKSLDCRLTTSATLPGPTSYTAKIQEMDGNQPGALIKEVTIGLNSKFDVEKSISSDKQSVFLTYRIDDGSDTLTLEERVTYLYHDGGFVAMDKDFVVGFELAITDSSGKQSACHVYIGPPSHFGPGPE